MFDTTFAEQHESLIDIVALQGFYVRVRNYTEKLADPLSEADAQLQSMPDVSPAKWHLAHVTWFFETFILCRYQQGYKRFQEEYNYLYNSYYNSIGEQYTRARRSMISRPSLGEVIEYRHFVDKAMGDLLAGLGSCSQHEQTEIAQLITLGCHHEQQHQELLLMDIKHCLFQNPFYPAYSDEKPASNPSKNLQWLTFDEGLFETGYKGSEFCFDNELPRNKVYLQPFELASRLVTNGEYLEFIESGAYQKPELWLSDGWAWLTKELKESPETASPLYWVKQNKQWFEYSLYGLRPLDLHAPVTHINYYEANAYAQWSGLRLPTEFEWEHAARQIRQEADNGQHDRQFFGQVWQWTSSSYSPYPGFKPFAGNAGEYNGKFMSNQFVLRGSASITPIGHARISYRNFFYAHQRWQYSGLRLAR